LSFGTDLQEITAAQVVNLLSAGSPVIVVLNKADERIREIDQKGLKDKFPSIVRFHQVSALTGRGLEGLVDDIRAGVARLPHVGADWPGSWSRVRRALETDDRNYIDLDEYLAICDREGLGEPQARPLSRYLHDLGVILHFQDDPLLSGTVILKPEWGTSAVYTVLDTRKVQDEHGRFSTRDLEGIWGHTTYPRSKHAELLRLMTRFERCFQLEGSDSYIVPELLPVSAPSVPMPARPVLQFEYHYDFMPAGIVTASSRGTTRGSKDDCSGATVSCLLGPVPMRW